MLLRKVEQILDDRKYAYYEWNGCFNLVANRRDDICIIKVLDNIDSIQEQQANNLKILSNNISAFTAIVGTHTRRESLEDNVVYERYGIPAMTTETFSGMLDDRKPTLYRTRGGFFIPIDSEKLRKARRKNGFSQRQLAQKIGVNKKFVYEHEKNGMLSDKDIVIMLENILNTSISSTIDTRISDEFDDIKLLSDFENNVCNSLKKIGFSTSTIHQAPFNIIAKEKVMIFSDAENNEKKARRNIPSLEKFSEMTKKPAVIISDKEIDSTLPVICPKELKDYSINDFKKLVKKR